MSLEDITILIKTFERPQRVSALVASILKYYKHIKIVIVDDSRLQPIYPEWTNVSVYFLPFDTGLSAGRNYGVDRVTTKYTLLLDDDFVFCAKTKIEKFVRILEGGDLDMIGGEVRLPGGRDQPYRGVFEMTNNRVLCYNRGYHDVFAEGYGTCDMILNFFLAKTEVLKKHRWDERQKVAEHTAYFWEHRGKIKVGYTPAVSVWHNPGGYPKGSLVFRLRNNLFFERWMEREGIKGIRNFEGAYFQRPKVKSCLELL